MNGYVTIFHEFIHCTQYLTCENRLKQELQITQVAALAKNYPWEINHPFPYQDVEFVKDYSSQLQALANHDSGTVLQIRRDLKRRLRQIDYEYYSGEKLISLLMQDDREHLVDVEELFKVSIRSRRRG